MSVTKKEVLDKVWKLDSGVPGPTVTVLGGIHGDEHLGVAVVELLLKEDPNSLVERGSLYLGIGNPEAVEIGKRFVPGDYDINRSFGDVFDKKKNSRAAGRAKLLMPLLEESDVIIDLHAATRFAAEHFTFVSFLETPLAHEVVAQIGEKTVVELGPVLHPGSLMHLTTLGYGTSLGKLALTVETDGWIDERHKAPALKEKVQNCLSTLGVSSKSASKGVLVEHVYEGYWSVPASDDFVFTQEWGNFEEVPEGTHFATDRGEELRISEDSFMLFQKEEEYLKNGLDACILLRKKGTH